MNVLVSIYPLSQRKCLLHGTRDQNLYLKKYKLQTPGLRILTGQGRPANYLQAWPRNWTLGYREQIQLAVRVRLELRAYELQVQRSNHSAILPPSIMTLFLNQLLKTTLSEPFNICKQIKIALSPNSVKMTGIETADEWFCHGIESHIPVSKLEVAC